MNMKKLSTMVLAGSVTSMTLASAPLMAEEIGNGFSTSANVAFTSDYVFRGISQSSEDFAVQGGFDLSHESGFYAGTWASSVDFDDGNVNGTTELDVYTGYATTVNEISLDGGFLHYEYPGSGDADFDYQELYVSAGYEFATVSLNYSYDYFGESGTFFYPALNLSHELPMGVGISGHVGYNSIDEEDTFGTDDYADWSISLSKTIGGIDASIAYHDTDLDDGECFGGSDLCDARAVFSIAKSF